MNKMIKVIVNLFLTVLGEKYTMKHHLESWCVCSLKKKSNFCVIFGHKIDWKIKTLPQNHAIGCAEAVLSAQFCSSVWCH